MTLDEAIERVDKSVDEWLADAKTWLECNPIGEPRKRADEEYAKCKKCAVEHYQIAGWLRELKEYRKQEHILEKIRAEIEGYRSTIDKAISEDEFKIEGMKEAYTDCIRIIDECKSESEE